MGAAEGAVWVSDKGRVAFEGMRRRSGRFRTGRGYQGLEPRSSAASGDHQEFGLLDGRRRGAVRAGLDAAHRLDLQTDRVGEESQLTWGVAAGPEVDLAELARLVADLGALVADAGVRVERRRLVVLHREVGVERA